MYVGCAIVVGRQVSGVVSMKWLASDDVTEGGLVIKGNHVTGGGVLNHYMPFNLQLWYSSPVSSAACHE